MEMLLVPVQGCMEVSLLDFCSIFASDSGIYCPFLAFAKKILVLKQ